MMLISNQGLLVRVHKYLFGLRDSADMYVKFGS
jgi:hypothetical protein